MPLDYDWSWTSDILEESFKEGKKCGVHALKNGNLILCETSKGQVTEVTKSGDIVWVYKSPSGSQIYNQNDAVVNADNGIFRGEKYLPTYAGFTGIDLTPSTIIENENSLSNNCLFDLGADENHMNSTTHLSNSFIDGYISFNKVIDVVLIYNLEGKLVYEAFNVNANMIELKETGWMSNRGRQNVASYFAKELLQDWRIGAAYFESMLLDYDVHSNYGNWMYVAGVGNDPRDRKFNTKLQAKRYDENYKYRKLWLEKTLF
mgnify:CR=1 FL=1